jgi:hypothetical protein
MSLHDAVADDLRSDQSKKAQKPRFCLRAPATMCGISHLILKKLRYSKGALSNWKLEML